LRFCLSSWGCTARRLPVGNAFRENGTDALCSHSDLMLMSELPRVCGMYTEPRRLLALELITESMKPLLITVKLKIVSEATNLIT
jgi:hypothetical protein